MYTAALITNTKYTSLKTIRNINQFIAYLQTKNRITFHEFKLKVINYITISVRYI